MLSAWQRVSSSRPVRTVTKKTLHGGVATALTVNQARRIPCWTTLPSLPFPTVVLHWIFCQPRLLWNSTDWLRHADHKTRASSSQIALADALMLLSPTFNLPLIIIDRYTPVTGGRGSNLGSFSTIEWSGPPSSQTRTLERVHIFGMVASEYYTRWYAIVASHAVFSSAATPPTPLALETAPEWSEHRSCRRPQTSKTPTLEASACHKRQNPGTRGPFTACCNIAATASADILAFVLGHRKSTRPRGSTLTPALCRWPESPPCIRSIGVKQTLWRD